MKTTPKVKMTPKLMARSKMKTAQTNEPKNEENPKTEEDPNQTYSHGITCFCILICKRFFFNCVLFFAPISQSLL